MSRHPSSFFVWMGSIPAVWSSIPRKILKVHGCGYPTPKTKMWLESLNSIGPFLCWSTSIILLFTSQIIVKLVLPCSSIIISSYFPSTKIQVGKDGLQHWLAPHWRVPGQEWCERLSGLSWHLWCYRQGAPGNQHRDCRAVVFVGITETWGDLLFVFFYWLVNVCASDLPYDIYDCVIHDVHFYLLGVHSPRSKNGDRHPSLPEKEKRTGPPGGFTNVPRRQWRGGHVEQGANTGCRWKSKTFVNWWIWKQKIRYINETKWKFIMHLLLVQNPWWSFEFLILMYSCMYVSMMRENVDRRERGLTKRWTGWFRSSHGQHDWFRVCARHPTSTN